MKFIPPPIVADGDYWSAADHNIYLADNFSVGLGGSFGSKGDILVGTDYQDGVIVPVGQDYDTLGVNYDTASWVEWSHTATGGEVMSNAGQSIAPSGASAMVQDIDCPIVLSDPYGLWDSSRMCFRIPDIYGGFWIMTVSGWVVGPAADAGKLVQIGFRSAAFGAAGSGYRYKSVALSADGKATWVHDAELTYLSNKDVFAVMTHQLSASVSLIGIHFGMEIAH